MWEIEYITGNNNALAQGTLAHKALIKCEKLRDVYSEFEKKIKLPNNTAIIYFRVLKLHPKVLE